MPYDRLTVLDNTASTGNTMDVPYLQQLCSIWRDCRNTYMSNAVCSAYYAHTLVHSLMYMLKHVLAIVLQCKFLQLVYSLVENLYSYMIKYLSKVCDY